MTGCLDHSSKLTISFKALQRAKNTLEDFTRSYFPYVGLNETRDFFKYFDVLVWVEATIYQLDEDNEQLTGRGGLDHSHAEEGIRGICEVLQQQGLLDEQVEAELRQGLHYWSLEQDISRRLLVAPRPLQSPAQLGYEEVLECHGAKSFDYRVLCLLLFRLTAMPYNSHLLAFLRVDEQLVDIGDDLTDYEDDVLANSFNVFRCFIHLYGREAELRLAERISWLEGEHRRLLADLPQPLREHYWRRHAEACEGQGSDQWVFPPPIYDEEAYRERVRREEAEAAPRQEAVPAAAGAACWERVRWEEEAEVEVEAAAGHGAATTEDGGGQGQLREQAETGSESRAGF